MGAERYPVAGGADESFSCIVETPKRSRNKYEFAHERHVIKLDRFLFSSVVYADRLGSASASRRLEPGPSSSRA